ncbi:MAG: hypothetical protein H8E31_01805 [Planctomycetes bacterium]|nr:hypothetical protein [Planctomycetota bacterium]
MEPLVFALPLLSLVVVLWILIFSRAGSLRDRWAQEQGFRLVSSRICWLWRGPFFFRSSNGQVVYRIEVVDEAGELRQGWLRCGGFFSGVWGSQTTVRWQEK